MRLSNPQRQPLKERLFDFRHRPVSLTPIPYLFARTVLPVFQQPHESLHFSEPDESYGEGQLTTVESNLKLPLSHWEYVYADTAPIRRPDARGSENRASADGYKIPQGKIDCGTRLNSAESLPVRADNAERGRGVKPQKSAISYNYNLACKLLPFAAPGDSRLHSLGTIPPNTKKPSRRFP